MPMPMYRWLGVDSSNFSQIAFRRAIRMIIEPQRGHNIWNNTRPFIGIIWISQYIQWMRDAKARRWENSSQFYLIVSVLVNQTSKLFVVVIDGHYKCLSAILGRLTAKQLLWFGIIVSQTDTHSLRLFLSRPFF